MKRVLLFIFIFLLITDLISAQEDLTPEVRIDKLFDPFSDESKPGVAAGLIKDGEIKYLIARGTADIISEQKITTKTPFQLGELSKQFTTLAILILGEDGKISFEDDIRKHIPELHEYAHTITIGHLLNHTSGLYDMSRISYMIDGTLLVKTQQEALQLIGVQKELAFEPGTEFSFHEAITESVLLAEIVARASGQRFSEFVASRIFEPLQMSNSFVRENSSVLPPGAAKSYAFDENGQANINPILSSVVGHLNVYCSAEDLAKWYLNFVQPNDSIGHLIQKLDTPVTTDDGDTFDYYWGTMAIGREFTHLERGIPVYWNYGFQGSYGTNIFRYKDQGVTSFVLGNNNSYNGGLAHDLVDIFVEDFYTLPENIDFNSKNIQKLPTKELKKYEGHYWFDKGYACEIFIQDDTLRSRWLFGKSHQTLVPLHDNVFQQYAKMEDSRIFRFKEEGLGMTLVFTYNESSPDIMKRYTPITLSTKELNSYEGTYYNSDYGVLFNIHTIDGILTVSNFNHEGIELRSVTSDVFTSTSLFLNAITFQRNEQGIVSGFKMITDGISDLNFQKSVY